MGATPKGFTAYFRGLSTGILYAKACYNPDVSLGLCRIDNGGGQPASGTTGTDSVFFSENVALEDLSCVTGIVDTGSLRIIANYNPTPHVILVASHLNTLNNRPRLNILFAAGTRIGFMSSLPAA
jgi:hypothetical protein